jgi:hypothetical protein
MVVTRGTHVTAAMAVAADAAAPRHSGGPEVAVPSRDLLALTLRALLDETGSASFVQVSPVRVGGRSAYTFYACPQRSH